MCAHKVSESKLENAFGAVGLFNNHAPDPYLLTPWPVNETQSHSSLVCTQISPFFWVDSRLRFVLLDVCLVAFSALLINGDIQDDEVTFRQNYAPLWGNDHIQVLQQSKEVQLSLDQNSGSGFQSLQKHGSGWFNMSIKIPQKDSTAVITTFYLQSDTEDVRDEIDFEFLGSNREQPYLMQTNIYTNGQGGREQRIFLWFDPSADFHNYTLLWNNHQVVFFVDDIPIRVFRNSTNIGGTYPTQAMHVIATIWSDTWASNGKPVNWNDAPFEAHYRGFGINGCQTQVTNDQKCQSSQFWWNAEKYWSLDSAQQQAYQNVRSNHMIYDYCSKSSSPECQNDQ